MKRNLLVILSLATAAFLVAFLAPCAAAANKYEAAMAKWNREEEYVDDMGGRFIVKATLYTTDYVNSLMESEAEKNLWTASELEDYKYNFLKGLNIEDYLAVHLELEELGPTAHMAPFNEMVSLWIGKTKYTPTDFDPRFNMPLQGKRDGMVYFSRFDEKTGKPLINKNMSLRLVINSAVSPVLEAKELRFTWDVQAQDTSGTVSGSAADRLEVDRLIRRLENLNAEKSDLESKLEAKIREIEEVNARIEELQCK